MSAARYAECDYRTDKVNPVTGEPKRQTYNMCHYLRDTLDGNCCGPDARFFEPKDPSSIETAMRDFLKDTVQ